MSNLNINGILKATGGGSSPLDVDLIEEQEDDFIRYENGIQLCYGRPLATTTGANPVTFPRPFKENEQPVVIPTFEGVSNTTNFYGFPIKGSVTNSGFNYKGYSGNYSPYIAIGIWKEIKNKGEN